MNLKKIGGKERGMFEFHTKYAKEQEEEIIKLKKDRDSLSIISPEYSEKGREIAFAEHQKEVAERDANSAKKDLEAYQKSNSDENLYFKNLRSKPETLELIKSFYEKMTRNLENIRNEPYNGIYSKGEDIVWEILKENFRRGNVVNAGTLMHKKAITINGLYEQHEHSVIDLFEKDENGRKMRYVRIRNPHGIGGKSLEYERDPNTQIITGTKEVTDNTGYSDITLNDFVTNFRTLSINGELGEKTWAHASTRLKEEPVSEADGPVFDRQTYLNYANAANKLDYFMRDTLSKVSSDSPEFTAMLGKLNHLSKDSYYLKSMKSKSDELCQSSGENASKKLKQCCEDYLKHCKDHPKRGDRRAKRIRYARATLALVERMEKGEKDPIAGMKPEIAERFLKTEIDKICIQDPAHPFVSFGTDKKNFIVNELLNNDQFKAALDGKDVIDLGEMCKNEPKELMKALSSVTYVQTLKNNFDRQNNRVNVEDKTIKRSRTIKANDVGDAGQNQVKRSNTITINDKGVGRS